MLGKLKYILLCFSFPEMDLTQLKLSSPAETQKTSLFKLKKSGNKQA